MDKQVAPPGADGEQSSAVAKVDFLEGYILEEDYARARGISERTAQRERQLRQSPPFTRLGRKIYYRVEGLKEWLRSREQHKDRVPTAPKTKKTKYVAPAGRDARDSRDPRAGKRSRSLPGGPSSDLADSDQPALPSNKEKVAR